MCHGVCRVVAAHQEIVWSGRQVARQKDVVVHSGVVQRLQRAIGSSQFEEKHHSVATHH